ncbi:MarR family transcriptional regulator [Clostridium gasigenes]|uniref:MarR family winged helix-turn-helix transcriptional regulator n=1 Tax=Clostridium gasigenes TaxID=94869 RepID=UPI001C0CDD02|nr:MarR family transcriptional regulator [Clostridium gasigenes]MBU3138085.1 MarR family transcriptional regulator [Clostridium gasigenes]
MNKNSADYADEIIDLYNLLWDDFHKISFAQFKKYKFTAPQAMAVRQLKRTSYITLKELSEDLSLSKSTVSGIVDRLEKQCVVVREIPEDNRRTVRLSLSPEFIKDTDSTYIKKNCILDTIKNTDLKDIEKMIYGLEKFHTMLSANSKADKTNGDEEHY